MGRVRTWPVARRYPGTALSTATSGRRLRDHAAGLAGVVVFVGHPRSGHSLVGALLDAHPDMVVAHEADLLKYVAAGFRRDQLIALLVRRERARVAAGHVSGSGYSYAVPGQWQGRWRRLAVVGDKRGRMTTHRLRHRPGLLDELERTVGVPVKVVQVVRNPYDNVATMHTRAGGEIGTQVARYTELSATVDAVAGGRDGAGFHRMYHEDLVADTPAGLADLCRFLGVDAPADWLAACDGIVNPSPHRTRDGVDWTPEARAALDHLVATTPWLTRYDVTVA